MIRRRYSKDRKLPIVKSGKNLDLPDLLKVLDSYDDIEQSISKGQEIDVFNKKIDDEGAVWSEIHIKPLENEKERLCKLLSQYKLGFITRLFITKTKFMGEYYESLESDALIKNILEIKSKIEATQKEYYKIFTAKRKPVLPWEQALKYRDIDTGVGMRRISIYETKIDEVKKRVSKLKNENLDREKKNLELEKINKIREEKALQIEEQKRIEAINIKNKIQELQQRVAITEEEKRKEARKFRNKLHKQLAILPVCPYCSTLLTEITEIDVHLDHIYPISKGGHSTERNLVFVCSNCNLNKKDLTLHNFLRKYSYEESIVYERLEILKKEF